ncbi:cytochrome P450 [Nocardiopsis potens]|uniref:cytochrome P450 n=1 Tax=Nocardiopsis potens TaxID=1246458 RepID=UPI00034D2930|nr:cytochrome P450 [Nocardiopsis potens]
MPDTSVLPFDRPRPIDPPPAYAELRRTAPVTRVLTPEGAPAWLVTSYDAAVRVLTDARFGVTPPTGRDPGNETLFQDGEPHARLRRLVAKAFTPRRIAALRPGVEAAAAERVAAMAAAGPPADLMADLAAPLSLAVIGDLLGVPAAARDRLRGAAEPALTEGTPQAWGAFIGYAGELIAAKRAELGDDPLSALIAVHDADDGRLTDGELSAMAMTLAGSGYLSTANTICTGAILLLDSGRLAEYAAAPERAAAVTEELLRRLAGTTGEVMPRWAAADAEVGGVRIAAGDMVLVRLEAAHHDPDRFGDPARLDPDRAPADHIAFGRGPHHCLGAALARTEVTAALRALAAGLPGLRLAVPVTGIPWVSGFIDSGPSRVPVAW